MDRKTYTKSLGYSVAPGLHLFGILVHGVNYLQGFFVVAPSRDDVLSLVEERGRKMRPQEADAIFGPAGFKAVGYKEPEPPAKVICGECDGVNLQYSQPAWHDAQTGEYVETDFEAEEHYYCCDCETHEPELVRCK